MVVQLQERQVGHIPAERDSHEHQELRLDAEQRIRAFIAASKAGEFLPALVSDIEPAILHEALTYIFNDELQELHNIRVRFEPFSQNGEQYTEYPETSASTAAVKMLDADGTIPRVFDSVGIPRSSIQWKTIYIPVVGNAGKSTETLTLLGGHDLLEQIKAKAFPPMYSSNRVAIAKLLECMAGQTEMFAQASMHHALRKNAITGSAEIDEEPYSAMYYEMSFDNPQDREDMSMIWLVNRLKAPKGTARVIFRTRDGSETDDITEATETGIFVHSDAVQQRSRIHTGHRAIPRESVALRLNGKMLQVSLKGRRRFDSFAERKACFEELNQPSIRAMDTGVERVFTPTEYLREANERLTELISNPLTNMNKQSISRLRERLIAMILHDARYVHAGMVEQNAQVQNPEVLHGYLHLIRQAAESIATIIDDEIEAIMNTTYEELDTAKTMVEEDAEKDTVLRQLSRIENGLTKWTSLRIQLRSFLKEITSGVEDLEQTTNGSTNQETMSMASFLDQPLLDLMKETARFNGLLSAYSLSDAIGTEAAAWERAVNGKSKKITSIGRISFEVHLPDDIPDIIGNEVFMSTALKNIILNAVLRNRGASEIRFRITVEPADVPYAIPNPQIAARLQETPLQWYRIIISNNGEKVDTQKSIAFNTQEEEYSIRADGTKSKGLGLARGILEDVNRTDIIEIDQPMVVMRPFEDAELAIEGTQVELLVLAAPKSLSVPQLV